MTHRHKYHYADLSSFEDQLVAISKLLVSAYLRLLIGPTREHAQTRVLVLFLSRSIGQTITIGNLVRDGNYTDAAILSRCVVERLLLLEHLHKEKQYEIFDQWCATRLAQQIATGLTKASESNWLNSFPKRSVRMFKKTAATATARPNWRRPKVSDMAKEFGMPSLDFAWYEYTSAHVHPTLNDGQDDYDRLFSPMGRAPSPLDRRVLRYSRCVCVTTLDQFVRFSGVTWCDEARTSVGLLYEMARNGRRSKKPIQPLLSRADRGQSLVTGYSATP